MSRKEERRSPKAGGSNSASRTTPDMALTPQPRFSTKCGASIMRIGKLQASQLSPPSLDSLTELLQFVEGDDWVSGEARHPIIRIVNPRPHAVCDVAVDDEARSSSVKPCLAKTRPIVPIVGLPNVAQRFSSTAIPSFTGLIHLMSPSNCLPWGVFDRSSRSVSSRVTITRSAENAASSRHRSFSIADCSPSGKPELSSEMSAAGTICSGFRLAAMERFHLRENLLMWRFHSSRISGVPATRWHMRRIARRHSRHDDETGCSVSPAERATEASTTKTRAFLLIIFLLPSPQPRPNMPPRPPTPSCQSPLANHHRRHSHRARQSLLPWPRLYPSAPSAERRHPC